MTVTRRDLLKTTAGAAAAAAALPAAAGAPAMFRGTEQWTGVDIGSGDVGEVWMKIWDSQGERWKYLGRAIDGEPIKGDGESDFNIDASDLESECCIQIEVRFDRPAEGESA